MYRRMNRHLYFLSCFCDWKQSFQITPIHINNNTTIHATTHATTSFDLMTFKIFSLIILSFILGYYNRTSILPHSQEVDHWSGTAIKKDVAGCSKITWNEDDQQGANCFYDPIQKVELQRDQIHAFPFQPWTFTDAPYIFILIFHKSKVEK